MKKGGGRVLLHSSFTLLHFGFRNAELEQPGLGLVAELLGGEALDGVVIHGAFLRQGEGFGAGEAELGGEGLVFHGEGRLNSEDAKARRSVRDGEVGDGDGGGLGEQGEGNLRDGVGIGRLVKSGLGVVLLGEV